MKRRILYAVLFAVCFAGCERDDRERLRDPGPETIEYERNSAVWPPAVDPSVQDKVYRFNFADAPVEQVVEYYEALAGHTIYGSVYMTGTVVSCSSDGPVARDGAMQLLRDALLDAGYIRSRAFEPVTEGRDER